MRKMILVVFVVIVSLMAVSAASAANIFNLSTGTNGGANRFWVTDDCSYRISGQAVSGQFRSDNIVPWLQEAARLYDGTIHSTGNLSGNAVPNIFRVNENGRVTLGGRGVGGNFQWDFASEAEGQNFLNFLLEVKNQNSDLFLTNCGLPLPSDFDESLDTNGGANRFYIENGQYKIWGQSVSGIFMTTDIIDWVQEAARLYDCDTVRTGNYNFGITPNIRRAQANGRAVLGGRGVGGQFVWQCDNQAEAQNFVDFLNLIANADLFEVDITN